MANKQIENPCCDTDSSDQLIDEILNACPSGFFDEEWIRVHYPDLPSEMLELLRFGASIRHAQNHVSEEPNGDVNELEYVPSDDEIEFLRLQIPGYTIIQPLGRGGQAFVYEAMQESTQRRVAIKLLHQGPLASPSQVARFKREISVVSQFNHPNIAHIYESGVLQGHYWFSMECVDGAESIDDYVLLHQPSIRAVIELMIAAARAVGFAHQSGVIHRDIKPSNILVDERGQPRVVDFGLAKEIGEISASTLASTEGHFLGTLPYLSPEQVGDANPRADVRSDVYALGLVLYQLVTGGFPYVISESPFAVREKILHSVPIQPRKIRADCKATGVVLPDGELDDDCERIILKALAKETDRRYQSALDFADDLQRYLNGEAIEAKSGDYWYNLRKTLRRYRVQVTVACLFALVLGISLAFSTSMWLRAEKVAYIAKSGLETVGFNALGSVARDLRRRDDAIKLFETSIRISEMTDRLDPTLLAARFEACHNASWMFYHDGDIERANKLRDLAAAAWEMGHAERSNDDFWSSKRVALHKLDGYRANLAGNATLALVEFCASRDIVKRLLATRQDDALLLRDLAHSLRWIGETLLDLKNNDDALTTYQESHAISDKIIESKFGSPEDVLDTIRCRIFEARCLGRKGEVVLALGLLDEARKILETVAISRDSHRLDGDVKSLGVDIDANYKFQERKLRKTLQKKLFYLSSPRPYLPAPLPHPIEALLRPAPAAAPP